MEARAEIDKNNVNIEREGNSEAKRAGIRRREELRDLVALLRDRT